jgi:hypothetical protein
MDDRDMGLDEILGSEPRPIHNVDGSWSEVGDVPEAIEGFNVCPDGRVLSRDAMVDLMADLGLEDDEAEMFCDDFGLYE